MLYRYTSRLSQLMLTKGRKRSSTATWTFFSNHTHVLVSLSASNDKVLKEVAFEVGITERAVQKIVAELEDAGILFRTKVGRRNSYRIKRSAKLRHKLESHRTVGHMLDFVKKGEE